jgi:hypothetical protein
MSPSFVPLFFSAGAISWQETVVLAAGSGVLQTLWKPRRPPIALQVAFNGANLAIAMGAAFAVSRALGGNQILLQLAVAALVFEVLNHCVPPTEPPPAEDVKYCNKHRLPYGRGSVRRCN